MSSEDDVKAECRLHAVEWAVSLLFAAHFRQAGDAGAVLLEQRRQEALAAARQQTFPSFDPAMSDLYSAELEASIDRLLGMAKAFLATGPSDRL